MPARSFVRHLLHQRLSDDAWQWLDSACTTIANGASPQQLAITFSSAVRHCGKAPLALSANELCAADAACAHWLPQQWSIDSAARVLLILCIPQTDHERHRHSLDMLFQSADLHESIALYRSIPLLPCTDAAIDRACEGLRSNIQAVFTTVAHNSPFPQLYLPQNNWNQMILKALFIEVPLHPIVGLDAQSNPALTQMLCDYAHERWAAQRTIAPELWRCVGHCANDAALDALERLIQSPHTHDRCAAQNALRCCVQDAVRPRAHRILHAYKEDLP